jgi:hypothetical protein
MTIAVVIAALVILAIVALASVHRAGYRGAIRFENRYNSEIATIRLTGFSKPVDCRTRPSP